MDKTGRLNFIELGIDDMTNLVELSDESLLYNLQTRYSQKIIYTYIGSILISINPYKELNIYDQKQITKYHNKSMQELPPHLFGIAEINYSKMMMENENQVIVISGESGAGKTESFKRLLRYLAFTSGGVKELSSSDRELSSDIANKILDSTPLLESFGNAKTIRNDNSSRFGKYVEIFFENGSICGSRTTNYLLEKSRIVNINSEERGYHIFYELLQGLDSFGKSQYYLKNVADYAYLNNAKDFSVKGRDDAANLKEFMSQWSTLGLTNDDLDVAMRIVSAVLHLGNIRFGEEDDASCLLETGNVDIVAKMLKVDSASLISCLTMKTTDTVKDIASSPVNAEQAGNLRDTLAKHLYSELFDWIVAKVNESLNQKTATLKRTSSHLDRTMASSTSKFRCIAMLDIYGFENFPENSLEQLCINYANETLQQFFNRYVFELEQAEYKQEGISWHYVTYPDNQPIINLLAAKPSGIIQILNDECSIPQGSDESFLAKCHNVHQQNANFEKPKKVHPPQFIIRHFAGNIYYNVTGFLDKNRDIIRKDAIGLIEHCGVKEIAMMFRRKKERTIKNPNIKARTPAVMADFQNSLQTLLNKMKTCQPWFIRCLKPNKKKEPLLFDKEIVMDQMRYTGILETVKIRKSGFPIRIIFGVFLSRFYLLQSKDMRRFARKEPQEACLKMLPKFGGQRGKEFEVGKTKLFLKETFARYLESQVRIIREKSAIKIQRCWRAYWKIRLVIIRNRAATKLQAIARGFIERRRIRKLHLGIVKLQSYVRMQLIRQKFIQEHPEFLKYSSNRTENNTASVSTIAYKFPTVEMKDKSKKRNKKEPPIKFNYNLLKIPMKLAFLLEKSTENYGAGHGLPRASSIIKTSRAQHLYNRSEYKLPEDIDDFIIDDFVDSFGNNVSLDSKTRPIQIPFLLDSMTSEFKEDSLNAHRLLLRLLYVNSMPWLHQYLAGSYLSFMASTSPQMQMEIIIQIITETINPKTDGQTAINKLTLKDIDSKRISRAWTLLSNILGHVILVPHIFNYVLKYISTSFRVDQAVTCQEKLLQFVHESSVKIPRLFPASNLEWRANIRGSRTALKVLYADDLFNSVHVNSFSTAEGLANHSLCFRLSKFRLNRGWSVSLISENTVVDCSGQNYVLDIISGLELTSHWADIVGYGIEHKFLVSRTRNAGGSNIASSKGIKSTKKPVDMYDNKSIDTIISRQSMDSWVDRYFDKSFKPDDTIRVHDFIHGLEDDLKDQRTANTGSAHPVNPLVSGSVDIGNQGIAGQHRSNAGVISQNSSLQSSLDRRQLEEQLNAAQLQNQFFQTSIENELLQKRLNDLRQQNTAQSQPTTASTNQVPTSNYQHYNKANVHYQESQPQHLPRQRVSSKNDEPEVKASSQSIPPSDISIARPTRRSLSEYENNGLRGDQEKSTHLKKRRSIVKYSEVAPASNIIVDDNAVLPELKRRETKTLSQLRAAEIPKVNVAHRAAFLDKFFEEKQLHSPAFTNVKRKAPSHPVDKESQPTVSVLELVPTPVPRRAVEHVTAPHPLVPERNSIPRPIIDFQSHEDEPEPEIEEVRPPFSPFRLRDSVPSDDESMKIQIQDVKKRRKRISSLHKTATILSRSPNIHYFTYTNVPWFLMVKIEVFLPKEIRDLTILNPIIFCQIVRDLAEFPCIRWVGSERTELLHMIRDIDTTHIPDILSTPSNVVLNVIDRAQNCELYFSRFYSVEWPSTNTHGQVVHWLAISHTGIRFVEQNLRKPDSDLRITGFVPYVELRAIICEDYDLLGIPQKIIIKTSAKKRYEMMATHALSAMNLINEFAEHNGGLKKEQSVESLESLSRKKRKRKPLNGDDDILTSRVMTFDVDKRRIPLQNVLDSGETAVEITTSENLIDFMLNNSKYKNRMELESVILRWQKDEMSSPLLPTLNHHLAGKVISMFNSILVLSGERPVEPSTAPDYGVSIFKSLIRSKELIEEATLQTFKQINGNENTSSRQGLWNLVTTIILFFGVSKRMEPYLSSHLKQLQQSLTDSDKKSINSIRKLIQKTLLHGPRKEMPLDKELRLSLAGERAAKMTIYTPRDSEECMVRFSDSVGDVIRNICHTLGVTQDKEIMEYSLAMVEVNEANEPLNEAEYLSRDSYMFDFINSLAKNKQIHCIFYFSRNSWVIPIDSTKLTEPFVTFIFNQLSNDVLCEKWILPQSNNSKLLKLIVDISYFNLKGQGYDLPLQDDTVAKIFPILLLEQISKLPPKSDIISMINSVENSIDRSSLKEILDYKKKFIELVLQLPLYGWITFPIQRLNILPSSTKLNLNFTPSHIAICNEYSNEMILKISLTSFQSFTFTKINKSAFQFVLCYKGNQEIQFVTGNHSKLVFLLNQYLKMKVLISTGNYYKK